MTTWRQIPAQLWDRLLDGIYPPMCVFCQQDDSQIDGSTRLCLPCREKLAPLRLHVCQRCDAPVGPHLDTSFGCIHCRTDRFAFDRVLSLGPYEDELRTVCQRLKKHHEAALTTCMGVLLSQRIAAESTVPFDFVLPVPHHWSLRMGRRAAAAELLADVVSQQLSFSCERFLLTKIRRTARQSTLLPTKRRNNLRSAFRLRDRRRVAEKRILLIDDVLTTGTTANRIARLLRDAGAQSIIVAVLARGLGDVRDLTPF